MTNSERYRLLQLIFNGEIRGKQDPGRRRIYIFLQTAIIGLFRAAFKKVQIAIMYKQVKMTFKINELTENFHTESMLLRT